MTKSTKMYVYYCCKDYLNFSLGRSSNLPLIQDYYYQSEFKPKTDIHRSQCPRDGVEYAMPKTFTTRRGALLIFSEEIALKSVLQRQQDVSRADIVAPNKIKRRHLIPYVSSDTTSLLPQDNAVCATNTVDEFSQFVLKYGTPKVCCFK